MRALAIAALAAHTATALNAGFSTYFLDGCPPNWTEVAFTQGRLIVSVVDGNQSGLVLGEPLNDQEDRSHVHAFSGALTLTEKHIASIGCCDDDGAHNGADPYNGVTTNATSGLPFLQLFLCALSADDDTLSLPMGAVGYMNPNQTTACPAQWAPYEIAAGRAIITGDAPPGAQPVTSVDLPLANLEDRAHSHDYTTIVTIDSVSFVGIDGCCDDSPAAAGQYNITDGVDAASTGLPYAQLLTCVSSVPSFAATMPDNALFFSPQLGCQSGWEVASFLAGRFIVSVPQGGLSGATFGGDSLSPGATALAGTAHQLSTQIALPDTGVGLAAGCCADGYAGAGSVEMTADSTANSAGLPFIMVPPCIKTSQRDLWRSATGL